MNENPNNPHFSLIKQTCTGGSGLRGARVVDVAGRTLREYKVYYDKLGVRPAMWIETNS